MASHRIYRTWSDDYWIRVMFHGLMTGCFVGDDNRRYDVGILNPAPPYHQLSFRVEDVTDPDHPIVNETTWDHNNPVRLIVEGPPEGYEYVAPFQTDEDPFDRHKHNSDRYDFRWIIDFESDEFYGELLQDNGGTLVKRPGDLKPRFRLENSGVLFTLIRSVPIIKEKGRRTRVLGRVTQIAAANIYHSDAAILKIPGKPDFFFDSQKKYNVILRNDCGDLGDKCFDDDDTVDTTFLQGAFRIPVGEEQIRLTLGLEGDSAKHMLLTEIQGIDLGSLSHIFDFLRELKPKASKYNPCGKAYYGNSDSLDEPVI